MPYPTSIRLPEDVRRVLRKEAKLNRRTITEQINFILQMWIRATFPEALSHGRGQEKVPNE